MKSVSEMTDDELIRGTGGCTESTCIYHHELVAEIRRRASPGDRGHS